MNSLVVFLLVIGVEDDNRFVVSIPQVPKTEWLYCEEYGEIMTINFVPSDETDYEGKTLIRYADCEPSPRGFLHKYRCDLRGYIGSYRMYNREDKETDTTVFGIEIRIDSVYRCDDYRSNFDSDQPDDAREKKKWTAMTFPAWGTKCGFRLECDPQAPITADRWILRISDNLVYQGRTYGRYDDIGKDVVERLRNLGFGPGNFVLHSIDAFHAGAARRHDGSALFSIHRRELAERRRRMVEFCRNLSPPYFEERKRPKLPVDLPTLNDSRG